MEKKILMIFILTLLLFSCKNKIDQETKRIDSMNMFKHNIEYYIDKPIKYLILESKSSIKQIGFNTTCVPFVIDGLILTFSNDVTIVAYINSFKHVEKRNKKMTWDINKCILENTSNIVLVSAKSNNDKEFKQTLLVEYICLDSLLITRHLYYNDTLIK